MTQLWFGEPWPDAEHPAPVCEDPKQHTRTPVGQHCLYCDVEIVEGAQGTMMPFIRQDKGSVIFDVQPAHRECTFRQVVGGPAHVQGTCTCQGGDDEPDMGMSPRQAALWVWNHYQQL